MQVSSIDELIDNAIANLNSKSPFEPILFSEPINFFIKLEGAQWDGYVDVKVAQFVIDLQASFKQLLENTIDVQNEELLALIKSKIVVKVQVEKGCTKVIVEKAEKILEVIMSNMSGWQKVVTASVFAAVITGAVCHNNWLEYKASTTAKIQDEMTKRAAIEMIDRRDNLVVDLEKPIRGIVQKMAPGDKITLPNQENSLNKDEAKGLYPHRPRSSSKTAYIDGCYTVQKISYGEDGQVYFFIEIDGIKPSIKAAVDLIQTSADDLYNKIKECHQAGEMPKIDLQVTAKHTSKKITSASIIGVGLKRDGSKRIIDLFQ